MFSATVFPKNILRDHDRANYIIDIKYMDTAAHNHKLNINVKSK